jgi:hypothetical protein
MAPDLRLALAKLIPLLGSDQPGEVVATAQAMRRKLEAKGLGLGDLATFLLPASPEPQSIWQGPAPNGLSPAIARELLRDIRRSPGYPDLSAWERTNIEVVAPVVEMCGPLSKAQQRLLRNVHAKLRRP